MFQQKYGFSSIQDRFLEAADTALRTLLGPAQATEPSPALSQFQAPMDKAQKNHSGALMRVNHVGEVCAQALYTAQAVATRNPELRAHLWAAAREETNHLAWTRERLDALGSRPSLLNPLWFAGAFALGLTAAKVSDRISLGFVAETETQVSAHLQSHLERLPQEDAPSRAVVERMKSDEERHANQAFNQGAGVLPAPIRVFMKAAAKVMTTTAYYL